MILQSYQAKGSGCFRVLRIYTDKGPSVLQNVANQKVQEMIFQEYKQMSFQKKYAFPVLPLYRQTMVFLNYNSGYVSFAKHDFFFDYTITCKIDRQIDFP